MKKTVAFLMTFVLFFGAFVMTPVSAVSAEDGTLDSHLISHWDFAGNDPLADKAPAGVSSDTVELHGLATTKDGTLYIPDGTNQNSVHYATVADSSDLLRTAESRTFFIVFKTDKTFDSGNSIELASQNGAMRIGVGTDSKVFASTNPHKAGENWAQTDGMKSSANTWMTLAISYDKNENGTGFKINTFFRNEGGDWVSGTVNWSSASKTWQEDNSDSGKTDGNALNIGRNVIKSYNSTWGGNLTIDDIRIYNKALTLDDVKSIEITNPTSAVVSKGHSLTLSGEIGVNFYLGAAGYLTGKEVNVTVVNGDRTLLNQNVTLNSENRCTEVSEAYKFTAPIAAKEMTDILTLTVKSGDTVLYTEEYSAKQYADQALADTTVDAKTVNLVKAMLDFGGYAQTYFGYSTDALANKDLNLTLPDISGVDATTYSAKVTGSVTGIEKAFATLKLESKTCIVFSLTLAEGVDAADYTVEGGTVEKSGNKITVTTTGICAQSLTESSTLTVKKGEETLTVTYSPMTYLVNQRENGNENLTNLLKALYAYYTAASAYVTPTN